MVQSWQRGCCEVPARLQPCQTPAGLGWLTTCTVGLLQGATWATLAPKPKSSGEAQEKPRAYPLQLWGNRPLFS